MASEPEQFSGAEHEKLHSLFNSDSYDPDGIGYCVSGGGYKAAAFHLGGFIRLNEVGLLPRIRRIASVSGGSIAAGLLGARWQTLTFNKDGVATNFHAAVVDPLKEFLTEVNLDVYDGIAGVLNPFESAADNVAKGYREHLVGKATLQDLPDEANAPRFVFLATNYELNSLWRFSRKYAADYRVGSIDAPTFPLAQIIAASSAFPPFFCPLTLDLKKHGLQATEGADKTSGDFTKRALLCDGGIYDNMGLEPIWKRYHTLLVSNAGDPMQENEHPGNWAPMMRRIIGMMHRQAENNRVRMLMLLAKTGERRVVYWPLRNDGANYPTKSPLKPLDPKVVVKAQSESVRLWSLGPKALNRLANHGYYLADSALRSYLPTAPTPEPSYPFKNE